MSTINPNKDKSYIDAIDLEDDKNFPFFVKELTFDKFRHIDDVELVFKHPITVISGVNRIGKSTILMALACSHERFMKRNSNNGLLERQTWSSVMQFTSKDVQSSDWTYHIIYKVGKKKENKRGQRKASTKKWNGIAKKEGQFKFRSVVLIDLDRCLPARFYSAPLYNKSKNAQSNQITTTKSALIEEYMSYILEETFTLQKLASHQDKDIFTYKTAHEYSSYNAATGEETLIRIILDTVEAEPKSLILIDEIEICLHPKIQRRLIDVLYHIAKTDNKQFILTTHSSTILSCTHSKSRIFLDKLNDGSIKVISEVSVNQALSKMDSLSYPIMDLYCEDELSAKIIEFALVQMQIEEKNIKSMVNIIASGSASNVYQDFQSHFRLLPKKKIKTGCACILDGDQQEDYKNKQYVNEIYFMLGGESPDKILVDNYEKSNPHVSLRYHIETSDNHILFDKMVELGIFISREIAIQKCCELYFSTQIGMQELENIVKYIKNNIDKYSLEI